MTSNASIGLRPWEIGQFRDIAENQATFETLQLFGKETFMRAKGL